MIYARKRGVFSYLVKPFLLFSVLLGIFGLVWLRSGIISLEYEIGRMERQKAGTLRESQALRAELASLLSIKQVAERKISLVFPDRERVIYVRRGDVVGPRPASLRGEGR